MQVRYETGKVPELNVAGGDVLACFFRFIAMIHLIFIPFARASCLEEFKVDLIAVGSSRGF